MREIVVDVQHVSKSFGSEQVLEDVTLQLMRGKIHGIIGRNGSGKTVLMKCICGFLRPTAGKISVFGKNIGTDCDFAPKTGMLIETPGFLPHETGMSNLLWLAKLGNGARCEDVAALMRLVGLDPAAKKRVSHYSLGMRQRLCFAMQIVTDTPYMLMDEVMNGLDPTNVELISNVLKALREQKKAIVIASHILTNLDSYADRVLFLKDGKIIHEYLGRKSLVNEPLYVKTDSADFLVVFPELTTVTIDLQGRIYLVEISDPQLPQRFIAAGITDFSVGHLALNELYLKYFPENS